MLQEFLHFLFLYFQTLKTQSLIFVDMIWSTWNWIESYYLLENEKKNWKNCKDYVNSFGTLGSSKLEPELNIFVLSIDKFANNKIEYYLKVLFVILDLVTYSPIPNNSTFIQIFNMFQLIQVDISTCLEILSFPNCAKGAEC